MQLARPYARVSTLEQETDLQCDALRAAGVVRIVQEKRSGAGARPELERLLHSLQPGDLVLVYKVDRFARSLADLLRILQRIDTAGAQFRSLTEPIDTTTAAGRMLTHLLGAFAEFERSMIRERSMAGQDAAWARGVKFGRKPALSEEEARDCYRRWKAGETSRRKLAFEFGVTVTTMSRTMLRVETSGAWSRTGRMRARVQARA